LWTAGQAWRRPALPPLRGQYPGRGAVSRPSSEWGRVGPARCDHQVGTTVQKTENRRQRTDQGRELAPDVGGVRCRHLSREARGMGSGQSSESIGQNAGVQAASFWSVLCPLSSGARSRKRAGALGAERRRARFERLGPVGCTRCRASTSGLSTWWSTTALDETWFGGGFPA
jgi:hypothetical protein